MDQSLLLDIVYKGVFVLVMLHAAALVSSKLLMWN